MDQYYRIKPTVNAIQYTDETQNEIITKLWNLGYFVKFFDGKLLVMLAYDNDWTTVIPGSYLVFDADNMFSIEFSVLNEDAFRQEYARYIPKEENHNG